MSSTTSPPRLYLPQTLSAGALIDLPAAQARHVQALRLGQGDALCLFNGEGGEYPANLVNAERGKQTVQLGAWLAIERESPLAITLALGISAGDRMDFALQKATELGVARIVPIAAERSVVRLSDERALKRMQHWQGILASACEQCGRNRLPQLQAVSTLAAFLANSPPSPRLMLALQAGPDAPRLRDLQLQQQASLLIGPEGGYSERELALALQNGFEPLRIGPRVLRTETAPLAVIAALQALYGDC